MKKERELQFWEHDDKLKVKILHTRLLEFLEKHGFAQVKLSDTHNILVREIDKRITMTSTAEADQTIKWYLKNCDEYEVYETYAKGIGGYFGPRKINLLPSKELVNDRDNQTSSNFYFMNCFCKVTKEMVEVCDYKKLDSVIWKSRVIQHDYNKPKPVNAGQFEIFCSKITGNSEVRFQGLRTILGYLMHRNKDIGESKAIILYDEKMGQNNQAHGGTGKTLLSDAISLCRDVASFDGKEIKTGSWFKNQRIEITTDVLVYDDLNKDISLENFYAMITSGIEVEKKRQQAFYIKHSDSPKILITSNYPVKGPGGSSDERRRHEFELTNYYSQDLTPEMEFGNRFFGNEWDQDEWNRFYHFMMSCVKEYLIYGLIKTPSLNLGKAKLIDATCDIFVEFADEFVEFGNWQNKRDFESAFRELYPEHADISSHMIKKWLDAYAADKGTTVGIKSSAGDYFFKIRKEVQDA